MDKLVMESIQSLFECNMVLEDEIRQSLEHYEKSRHVD